MYPISTIVVLLILALVAVSIWLVVLHKVEKTGCSLVCRKPKLLQPHPPLVVISLDGFAHKYLTQRIQPTLDRIAECGVFPSFPSQTYPNHVTLSNGLFPGHHGIVSNQIYDVDLSSKPIHLRTSFGDGYYVKEPIWSVYQRETKKYAATISWIGTYHNTTYYQQPHYVVPFDREMSADEKFDKVFEYLKLDDEKRPGLIMTYVEEPDTAGHHKALIEEVYEQVRSLDKSIGRFFSKLKKEGMLGCVNIVVVSDHGMSKTKNRVVLEELLDTEGLVFLPGVSTLMFRNGSKLTDEEILASLTCKGTDYIRVFDRRTMPVRFHFSESKRIGDFVILGHEASVPYVHRSDIKPNYVRQHGFDFIDPDMFTIMFARGPSFKQGTVLPNFMNVEYMNLWTKLLQLSAQENDGDPDFMNLALLSSGGAPKKRYSPIKLCKASDNYIKNSLVTSCGCTDSDKQTFKNRAKCNDSGAFKAMIITSDDQNFCYMSECNEMAIIDSTRKNANVATLVEVYDGINNEQVLDSQCTFRLIERSNNYATTNYSENVKYRTLSAFPRTVLASNEQSLFIPWKKKFVEDVLNTLNDYTKEIVKLFNKVVSITGTAFDENYDGKYSTSEITSPVPTHLYRILLACDGVWSPSGAYCQKPEQTRVLSFIFPHVNGDPNCLDKNQLLLQYTARIKDVEILSGLVFNFTNLSDKQQMLLKLHVNTELW